MKLKIDDGSPHEPGVVYLRLVEAEPDHIVLEAVYDYTETDDIFAPGGGLLTITGQGRVALAANIDPDLGFALDHDGRLKLDDFVEAQTARRGAYLKGRARLAIDNTF